MNEFNNALVNEIILSAEETIPKNKGNRNVRMYLGGMMSAVKQLKQETKLLNVLRNIILKML